VSALLGSFALGLVQVRASRRKANRGVDRKADKGCLTGRITPPICRVFHLKTAREVRLAVHDTRCPYGDGKRASVNAARNLAHWRPGLRRKYGAQLSISSTSREVALPWVGREMSRDFWRHDTTDHVVGSRQNHGR